MTMMKRRNPFDDIEQMFDRMSRQFDEMGRQWEGGMGGMSGMIGGGMSVDVADYDDEIVVTADVPGFEKDDIDISIADRTLTLRAEREMDAESEEGEYLRRERRSASMHRTIRLPERVDEESASASYQNGVLTVTLPKVHATSDEDSHHIDVN